MTELTNSKRKLVSIVIPTFNRGKKLRSCIESLLKQSYQKLEIIISDDCSTDDTVRIVQGYKDPRIILIKNKVNRGPAATRNISIKRAKGEIIFFTDDDTKARSNWIEKSLHYFDDPQVVGIEGKIIYSHDNYREGYGDRVIRNTSGGLYMTANAAYRKEVLLKSNLFDPALLQYEDRELALRMLKYGKIMYAADAIVVHQLEYHSIKSFMGEAKKIRFWFMLMKKTGERRFVVCHIYDPFKLFVLLFPPAILIRLFTYSFRNKRDWIMWFLMYPRLWYERLLIWRYTIVNKIFIL